MLSDIRDKAGDILARRGGIFRVHEWRLVWRFTAFAALTCVIVGSIVWAAKMGAFAAAAPAIGVLITYGLLSLLILGFALAVRSDIDKRRRKKTLKPHKH
jgi:polyferredoxin